MPHITFVHGIANKPAAARLQQIWLNAIAFNNGIDLGASGVTTSWSIGPT